MSTLFREHTPFDILFRNFFKSDVGFTPAIETKIPHPLDIYYNESGLWFEVACTGLTKSDINIDVEGDLLTATLAQKTGIGLVLGPRANSTSLYVGGIWRYDPADNSSLATGLVDFYFGFED